LKYIAIDEIKDGMTLARDVVTPCGKTLLRKDLMLRAHFVQGLRWHQVSHVFVYGDTAERTAQMPLLSPSTKLKAIDIAKTMFSDIKMGRLLNDTHITALVGEMVDELLSQTKLLICLHRMGKVEDYLIEHSINTTIVSIVIGLRCGFPREKLVSLAKGAFLHDIGKTKVPDAILHKRGPLTTAEFEKIKLHPQLGFNIIRDMAMNIQTAMVSLQHHERFSGDGYPTELSGSQIHEFSRIVAIADVYDALTTDRCYRQGYTPDKALEIMATDRGVHFDPLLYDIFASEVLIYPIGTFVELSDGSIGNVVALTQDVRRPEISLFNANADGSFTNRRINLLYAPEISIVGSVS
jgi:HD-GYP domain-containing protein (c-di-GMP phosphodiesterase class II)